MSVERMRDFISQMIKPLRNRVYTMITRAVIEAVKDGGNMQLVKLKLLAGETRDDVERFQNFGFSSNPPDGSEAVAVAVGGNRDHLIVIVVDDRQTRFKNIEKGEAVMFTDDGSFIHLKKGGIAKISAATKVEIGAGFLEKTVNGETFKTFFNAHTHNGNLSIPTGPPILPMTDIPHLSLRVKAAK